MKEKEKVQKRHSDTTISLHPLSFDEAITKIVQTPKPDDSQAEKADNTNKADSEPEPSS